MHQKRKTKSKTSQWFAQETQPILDGGGGGWMHPWHPLPGFSEAFQSGKEEETPVTCQQSVQREATVQTKDSAPEIMETRLAAVRIGGPSEGTQATDQVL